MANSVSLHIKTVGIIHTYHRQNLISYYTITPKINEICAGNSEFRRGTLMYGSTII